MLNNARTLRINGCARVGRRHWGDLREPSAGGGGRCFADFREGVELRVRHLQEQGVEIVPVNPNATEVLGVPAIPSLAQVEGPIDAVVVFRPAAEALEITREAIALGAGAVWLQEGVVSAEAAATARDAGLRFVMDRCIGMTHGALGLGPGPDPEAAACAVPAAVDGSRRPAR